MKLDHIAINVSDIKKSIEWYVQNLSASVDYEDPTYYITRAPSAYCF